MKGMYFNNRFTDNLYTFFKDLDNVIKLDNKTELELIKKAQAGDIDARNRIIESNLALVIYCCNNYGGLNLLSFGDLITEGSLGIIKAIEKYDESKGAKFSTYAMLWIRQSINTAILYKDDIIRVPYNIKVKLQKITKAINFLLDNGHDITMDLLVSKLNMSYEEINHLLSSYPYMFPTLEYANNEKKDSEVLLSDLADDTDIEEEVLDAFLPGYLNEAFECLTLLEKEIIMMRFGFVNDEKMSVDRVTEWFGYGAKRCGVIRRERRALKKLKEYCEENGLKEYLRK